MTPAFRLQLGLWLAGLLCCRGAQAADANRYALLIGANRGQVSEPLLRYAHSDAQHMAEVLTSLGDFLPDNVVLLEDPSADRVRDALARLNARMRTEALRGPSLLFVYYSGHADSSALHLGSSALPWDELRNNTVGSAAGVRVLLVDACRSGAVTRVKGVDVSEPFVVPQAERGVEGFALVSSAAAGESAQEADSLGGSFFTHHWVSGLRGAADDNHDGVVTLAEAYRYAAQRTQASTAQTLAGVQHPTYAYGLKGYSDLALTRLQAAEGLAGLRLRQPAQVLLWRDNAQGPLVAEANVGPGGTLLRLPVGRYFVQQRLTDRMFEGPLELSSQNETVELDPRRLRSVTYAQYVRKGSGGPAWALSLWGGIGTPTLALDNVGPTATVGLLGSLSLQALSIDVAALGQYGRSTQPKITAHLPGAGAAAGVRKMFDVGPLALGFGARLGALYVAELYSTQRWAPARWTLAPLIETVLRADWHVGEAWFLGWELSARVLASRQQANTGALSWRTPTTFASQWGVGYQW